MALGDLIQSLGVDPLTGQSNLASPDAVKRQRELAAALGKEGMNYSPIQSPWQGAARLAQALSSGIDDWRANKSEAAGRASDAEQRNKLAEMLGGQTAAPQTLPAPSKAMTTADASPASSDPTGYRDAIASIESKGSGDYGAIGPKTRTGDQAFGRYQVMGANIPEWTQAALGKAMSPQEFLADQGAQDKVFDHRFGSYVSKYGNPQDAASAWFTGGPLSRGANKADVLGTTGNAYVDKFNAALGQRPPVQVASADPQQAMALAGPQPTQEGDPSMPPMPPVRPASLGGKGASAVAADEVPAFAPRRIPMSVAVGAATGAKAPPATADDGEEDTPVSPAAAAPPAPAPAAAAPDPQKAERIKSLMAVMANPWASAATQQLAASILQKEVVKPETYSKPYYDENKNYVQKGADGKISVLNKAESSVEKAAKSPATVQEYNYYRDQTKAAGQEPVSFLDYQKQKATRFANFDNDSNHSLVSSLAARAMAGDKTWKQGLSKEPGLIKAVETEVAKGGNPDDVARRILQNQANQIGRSQEQRTLGTASANNTLYGNVASNTLGSLITASRELPRSSWVPINKLVQMGEGAISDPRLARFRTAVMTTANDYAKATTPTGQPTDSQRNHAYEVLNTATGPEAVEAIADMMHQEIANTHRGINDTKKQLQSGQHGDLPPINVPKGGPGVPGSQSVPLFGGGNSGPPPAAVEHLKSNPTPQMRQFFDQKFGPGSSGKILGSGVTL